MSPSRQQIANGIYLLRFKSQYELASTFLRFQEHYESSYFRRRVFSLEDYMDWYAARFGAFTYLQDWSGFNVPSTAFDAFYDGRFNPLLRKEERLLRLFAHVERPFYVIGIYRDDDLRHELAHAMFFMRPAYRREIRAAMRQYNTTALKRHLASLSYHAHVLEDEVHAYLISGEVGPAATLKALRPLRKELRAIYRAHATDLRLPRRRVT